MRARATTTVVRLVAVACVAFLLMACGPASATLTPPVAHTHTSVPAQAVTSPVVATATLATLATLPGPTMGVPATATPVPATATTAPATPVAFAGDRLYVYDTAGSGRYLVIDSLSGRVERSLPVGTPSADWSVLYTATAVGGQTKVEAIAVATGATLRSLTLAGRFVLPGIGASGLPGGLASLGSTLVLAAVPSDEEVRVFERENRWVSRFAVLDTTFGKPARIVELAGNYSFDTLAPTGNYLYVIEHRPAVHPTEEYAVRVFDFSTNALRDGAVVDKASARQVMEGTPGEQVVARGGEWVYTIYRNSDYGPFVHALNVTNQFAMCIDLPKAGKEDAEAARLWSLALSEGGTILYAVNGALGQVVEISAVNQSVLRTAAFPPQATAPYGPLARLAPSAAAKRPMLHGTALTRDGRTLYLLGERGILVLDTATLTVRQRFTPDAPFSSIAVSSSGAELYVAGGDGQAQRRDAATGAVRGGFGEGALWGILHVEAKR
jgi:hypothetical protein